MTIEAALADIQTQILVRGVALDRSRRFTCIRSGSRA